MEQTNKTNLVSHQFSSIHRQKKLQRIIFSMTLANVQWGKISNVTNQFGYLKYCLVFDIPLWKIWDRQLGVFCPIYGKVKFMFQTTNQNILKCPHFQRVISAHQVNFGIHTTHFGWFRCSMCKHIKQYQQDHLFFKTHGIVLKTQYLLKWPQITSRYRFVFNSYRFLRWWAPCRQKVWFFQFYVGVKASLV